MSAVLATPPFLAFFDLNGDPLAGGLIYTYAAGTTTPKATYTDESGLIPMPNPIVLDSAGRATWWLIGAYKYIVKDALGNTIDTTDDVTSFSTLAAAGAAFFQSFSGDGTTTAFTLSTDEGTDSKGLMIFVDSGLVSNIANGTFTTDTIWTKGAGWTIGSGVATAAGAISTAISQTATSTLVTGKSYNVTYTITASAGSLTPSIGGQNGTARTAAGTYSEVIVAGSTQIIAFTGTGFTGTLDAVTVTLSAGQGYQILNPNQYTIAGTALTFAVAPATGINNIFVFAPSSLLGAASSAAALAQGYAAAALTSQTAAAVSASSAAGYAAAKNQWTYSTTTAMADPGSGGIRFNNATLASATAMAISNNSANSGSPDLSAWVATWDDSSSSPRGELQIFKDNGNFVIYNITGGNVDNSGWKQITLTYVSGAGTFANSDSILVGFTAYGTTIVTGGITALTGDVTASGTGSVSTTVAKIQGVTVTGTTGTGKNVFDTSPTLVTPVLGIASATSFTFPSGGNTALNWYEEGTFTPTLLGLGTAGSPTYVVQTGVFTRIGRMVLASARLQISNLGAMAGQLAMGGLPYAVNATLAQSFSGGELVNAAASTYSLVLSATAGTTQIWIFKQASTGTAPFSSSTDATNTFRIWISGVYSI